MKKTKGFEIIKSSPPYTLPANFEKADTRIRQLIDNVAADVFGLGVLLDYVKRTKLYKQGGYEKWSEYAKDITKVAKSSISNYMRAGRVDAIIREISTTVEIFPRSERQVRPLYPLLKIKPREKRDEAITTAWKESVRRKGKRDAPTEEIVAATVDRLNLRPKPTRRRRSKGGHKVPKWLLTALEDNVLTLWKSGSQFHCRGALGYGDEERIGIGNTLSEAIEATLEQLKEIKFEEAK